MTATPRTIAIVGASLAGISAARALRDQGFDGQVSIIGAEPHRPYDRPPLSKEFLAGRSSEAALSLEDPAEDLNLRWLLRRRAVGLDRRERAVLLDDGGAVRADAVILATGAEARSLPTMPAGVHTLRTLDDAWALRADLVLARHVVVVGAGFIGLEVAATVRELGLGVTVLEAATTPLAGPLGVPIGDTIAALHLDHGVDLRCGVAVAGFAVGVGGRVVGVHLSDGGYCAAEVVVLGIGARPSVDWLHGTGLDLAEGVACDESGRTSIPQVFAVGDCAAWYDPVLGRRNRVEHWTAAIERPAHAVRALLGGSATLRPARLPYFWSDQFDRRIQFAGHMTPEDEITIEDGSPAEHGFLAVYRRAGQPVAVLGVDRVRLFTQWRRRLETPPAVATEGRATP